MAGAYKTGKYRNVFKEYGYPVEEMQKRVEDTFNTIFYGNDDERFYHEAGDDMGYMEDTGNHDVRTEGMSYGMMVCVQLDKKAEFDRLWKWVRTYMYIEDGPAKNYFAWSCQTNGKRNADGPSIVSNLSHSCFGSSSNGMILSQIILPFCSSSTVACPITNILASSCKYLW